MQQQNRKVSAKAAKIWKRLSQWYGTRWTEAYGTTPPDDWSEIIDRSDSDQIEDGLARIRKTYQQYPPTLPQFEEAIKPHKYQGPTGPNAAERLCEYVMRTRFKSTTPAQVRGPWTYFGPPQGPIEGVCIPRDGEVEGFKIRLEDIQANPLLP